MISDFTLAPQLRSSGDGPLAFTFPDIESPQPQYSGPDHDRVRGYCSPRVTVRSLTTLWLRQAVDMLARAGMPPADVLKALHETPFDFVASSYHIILERLVCPGCRFQFIFLGWG